MRLLLFCGQSGCVEDSVVNLSAMSTFKGTKEASQVSEGTVPTLCCWDMLPCQAAVWCINRVCYFYTIAFTTSKELNSICEFTLWL